MTPPKYQKSEYVSIHFKTIKLAFNPKLFIIGWEVDTSTFKIFNYYTLSGYILTCFLSFPTLSNFTYPGTLAYTVSSDPIPTLCPG